MLEFVAIAVEAWAYDEGVPYQAKGEEQRQRSRSSDEMGRQRQRLER